MHGESWSRSRVKKLLPYVYISVIYFIFIFLFHKSALTYKFEQSTVNNYLRSQDIEDKEDKIKDRVIVSDSDIYISSGYLYAKGEDPTKYNFQHPPLIKYLFGYSTILTGNPLFVQVLFGLLLLLLTYLLGSKLFRSVPVAFFGTVLLMADPVFGGMINEALLDLGQTVFGLLFLILIFYYPKTRILQGIILGFFAASKFWSTAIIFTVLAYGYNILVKKVKISLGEVTISALVALLVFCFIYGTFDIFSIQGRILKFMITHNSANEFGGPLILFLSGYFAPWWQTGLVKTIDWSFLWPLGMVSGVILSFKKSINKVERFFMLLPFIYLLLSSSQVPFTRYFILILPLIYLSFSGLIVPGVLSYLPNGRRKSNSKFAD